MTFLSSWPVSFDKKAKVLDYPNDKGFNGKTDRLFIHSSKISQIPVNQC